MVSNATLLELFNNRKYDDLRKKLELNVIEENLKSSQVNTSVKSVITRYVEKCQKHCNKSLHKAHEFSWNGKKYYAMVDGFSILASTICHMTEIENEERRIKCEKYFNDLNLEKYVDIDISELKFFMAAIKSRKLDIKTHAYSIIYNDNVYSFNPEYLLDMLTFCGSNRLFLTSTKSSAFAFSDDEENISMVLPVNVRDTEKHLAKINEILKDYREQ